MCDPGQGSTAGGMYFSTVPCWWNIPTYLNYSTAMGQNQNNLVTFTEFCAECRRAFVDGDLIIQKAVVSTSRSYKVQVHLKCPPKDPETPTSDIPSNPTG